MTALEEEGDEDLDDQEGEDVEEVVEEGSLTGIVEVIEGKYTCVLRCAININ